MSLEGHSCWEDCDEGPHGCICGNDCEPPPWMFAPVCEHDWVDQWSGVKCRLCGALDGW